MEIKNQMFGLFKIIKSWTQAAKGVSEITVATPLFYVRKKYQEPEEPLLSTSHSRDQNPCILIFSPVTSSSILRVSLKHLGWET